MTTTIAARPLASGRWSLTDATEESVSSLRTNVFGHVRATLAADGRPHSPDDLFGIELVISELVTNAYRHGGPRRIDVLVAFPDRDFWIGVFDTNPRRLPRIDETGPGQKSHGQGMRLVDAFTDQRWGSAALPYGKYVTARCTIPDAEHTPRPPASHTPSTDGTAWLLQALSPAVRDRAVQRWKEGRTVPLPTGTHFDVVTAETDRAMTALRFLTSLGIRPGPVLRASAAVHFLVPPGTTWPTGTGLHHAPGRTLLAPRPGTPNWLTAPDGTGNLTDAALLADVFAHTARLPAPVPEPAP
ncbi:ATP-binding protein [Kitasatospora sp. NPDC088134]|uniref:ATP-binding protein n=1 Tax=Kitasatospora sp. NPDC088134 TaxID=3364071 RepID=UPI003829C70A